MSFFSKLFEPKPYHVDYLPPQDGHQVFFMEFGNPKGKPIVLTHGGPGGSCKPKHAQAFDLKKFRVIMMDQRGCGNSLPAGEMQHNTTADILEDMARLLDVLNIKEKVILRGGSWGASVALLFAEKYPEKVEKLLLSQVFLADSFNQHWMEEGSTWFYPDMKDKMCKEASYPIDLTDCYCQMINSDNIEAQTKAVTYYGGYERILGSLEPEFQESILDEKEVTSTRIYLNYTHNKFFLRDNEIMDNIGKIEDIPTVIVHNRLDMCCPLLNAYNLSRKMKNSKLVIVPDKGHVSKLLYKVIDKEFREFLSYGK